VSSMMWYGKNFYVVVRFSHRMKPNDN